MDAANGAAAERKGKKMETAINEELVKALRDALAALEKASPASASDWPAHEAAEKNARELLNRAA